MPQVRGRKSCSPPSPPYDEAMTSTITCPHCGLAQEPASDSVCRGCANPIAGVVAPAKSVLGLGKAVAAKALPLGARVAGVVLLLNAGANVLSMIKEGAGTGPLANQEVKGMIVDLVVGGGLLAGRATLQKWAIVRVVLGLIVFGAMFGAQHDMTSLTLQAGFSAALLLLLPAVVYQVGNLGLPLACAYYLAQEPRRSAAIARRCSPEGLVAPPQGLSRRSTLQADASLKIRLRASCRVVPEGGCIHDQASCLAGPGSHIDPSDRKSRR